MKTIIIRERTDDDIKKQLNLFIGDDRMTAEKALRHLIDEFDFDFEELLKSSSMGTNDHFSTLYNGGLTHFLSEKGLNISFSEVKYKDIAPSVGLDPLWIFYDAPLFDLHRSRIPTSLFKEIVEDMDTLILQFGTLRPTLRQRRITEDARSRVLAPVSILVLISDCRFF
jgi:hypothetical protein